MRCGRFFRADKDLVAIATGHRLLRRRAVRVIDRTLAAACRFGGRRWLGLVASIVIGRFHDAPSQENGPRVTVAPDGVVRHRGRAGCFAYLAGADARADRKRRASANCASVATVREIANPHSADPSPPSGASPKMRSIQSGHTRASSPEDSPH